MKYYKFKLAKAYNDICAIQAGEKELDFRADIRDLIITTAGYQSDE